MFENAGVPVKTVDDMDSWQKYHVAFINPIAGALLRSGDNYKLAQDKETIRMYIRAVKEGGRVLKSLGYTKSYNPKFKFFYWFPEGLLINILAKLFNSKFMMPIDTEISTPFGVKRFINKKPKNPHSGIDFKSSMHEPVKSINQGIVVFTGNHFFSGNSVYVDHGLGIISMYFHLSEIKVKKGDEVNVGDIIGLVGSTGRSTGPHLHWGVRINNIRVDPLSLIKLNEYF